MKIRIKGNSIRLRLTKTEVENFGNNGVYEEETQMIGGVFKYKLERTEKHETLAAEWIGRQNLIVFYMPDAIAKEWVESNEVGFQHKLQLENGTELFLLIEKDFVCLDNTFEDQSDNYPNPNAVC